MWVLLAWAEWARSVACRLADCGFHVTAVYDVNHAPATKLAGELGCAACQDFSEVTTQSDVKPGTAYYRRAVGDQAIPYERVNQTDIALRGCIAPARLSFSASPFMMISRATELRDWAWPTFPNVENGCAVVTASWRSVTTTQPGVFLLRKSCNTAPGHQCLFHHPLRLSFELRSQRRFFGSLNR